MIRIVSDMPVNFDPLDPFFDSLLRDASEEKLFSAVKNHLKERGIQSGFKLGSLGEHEEVSLLKNSEYWLVVYSERGEHRFLGMFRSYSEATDFFIFYLQNQKNESINWKDVLN